MWILVGESGKVGVGSRFQNWSPHKKTLFPELSSLLEGNLEENWHSWQVRGDVFVLTIVRLEPNEPDEQKQKTQHGSTSWIPGRITAVGLARRQLEARGEPSYKRQAAVGAKVGAGAGGSILWAFECGQSWPLNLCSRGFNSVWRRFEAKKERNHFCRSGLKKRLMNKKIHIHILSELLLKLYNHYVLFYIWVLLIWWL